MANKYCDITDSDANTSKNSTHIYRCGWRTRWLSLYLLFLFCTPQAQFKDMMRECEDLRLSRDDAINSAKETEKKVKTMEADAAQFQEVLRRS